MSRKANNLRKRLAIEKSQNAKLRRKAERNDNHVRLEYGRAIELTMVDGNAVEQTIEGVYLKGVQVDADWRTDRIGIKAEFEN